MVVYLVEDEEYGVQAVFLHESAAEDAIEQDTEGTLSPSGKPPIITAFEVIKQKSLIRYKPATITQ